MMADRGLKCVFVALGLSALVTGGAVAEESWPSFAQRCQTMELAMEHAMADPCEGQVAVFGLAGPKVLSRNQSFDVESTGSVSGVAGETDEDARAPL